MACLTIVLFSQIIDNIRNIKVLFIAVEIGITISVLIWGLILLLKPAHQKVTNEEDIRFDLILLATVY